MKLEKKIFAKKTKVPKPPFAHANGGFRIGEATKPPFAT